MVDKAWKKMYEPAKARIMLTDDNFDYYVNEAGIYRKGNWFILFINNGVNYIIENLFEI